MPNIPLLVQICFLLSQLSRQETQFSKLLHCHFLEYSKIFSCKKILKIHSADPEENASQTDRLTDGQVNRTDFIGSLL